MGRHRVKRFDMAVGQHDADLVRGILVEEIGEDRETANDRHFDRVLPPAAALLATLTQLHRLHIEPPAHAKVALPLIAAVIDTVDGERQTGQRDIDILKGEREVAHLLVARHLHESGVGRLIVANRTLERAHALAASFAGYAIALDEIPAHLGEADIVIASTASPDPLLGATLVRQCLKQRRHRPMFMVDLAVPRDIDPAVAELDDVYLYTVDDLKDIIQDNLRSRQAAAQQAEEIIDTQVEHFMAWLRAQGSVASIRALRRQAEATRDEAMDRARRQLAQGKDPTTVLEMLAHTLTNKFLHVPCTAVREAAAEGDAAMLNLIKTLYRLGDGDPRR